MEASSAKAYSGLELRQSPTSGGRKHHRAWNLLFVLVSYLLAGEIGLAAPFTSGNVSPLWPPAGVALAAMLMFGYSVWPAVLLGAFVVNYFTPIPHLAALGIAAGNTAGPLCGAWLLRRLREFNSGLPLLPDVLALSTLGALGGTAVSATVGVGFLFAIGVKAWSGSFVAWLIWWLGDALGVLVIAPLLLTCARLRSVRSGPQRAELACLLLGATGSAIAIFDPHLGLIRAEAFAFGVFPFVLWGAIRFEVPGVAAVSTLISAVALWGTAHGFGPFIKGNAVQNATLLQSFLAVTSVSGIVLAAVITERAQLIREQSTREALERSEQHYRGIVETGYEGIWKVDRNFNTSFVNRRMAEMLGYTDREMLGRSLFDFVFESDFDEKRQQLQRRRGGVSEQIEGRYRKKDGSVLWTRIATSPLFREDGAFDGALAMISDLTEHKRDETEQHRAQEMISLLSEAVRQTADSVVITDDKGSIEYVNPAFETTTGYAAAEVIGNTPRILKSNLHDRDFYMHLWAQILRGETFRGTLINRKKSGELYWAEQTITPIRDTSGTTKHYVSVLKDMTDARTKQEQQFQLRLAREVQQRFYAGAAINVAGFEIASCAYPAVETGGDYLDMFSMPDGRICIGVGDVSGHGLGSALVMALTRAYVRCFARVEADVAEILKNVNHMLISDLENSRYVTLLLVCLDGRNRCMSFANAGHIPGLLMNACGEVEHALESSGPPLGLFEDSQYVTRIMALVPRQFMLLLTDGISEMQAAEDVQFGTDRILEYIRSHKELSAREIAEGLYQACRNFAGGSPQLDDVTEVVIKVA